MTKYLSIYSEKVKVNGVEGGRLELLDSPNEYSVITVQNNGSNERENKLRFVNKDGWAINKKGSDNSQGFQSYSSNGSDNNEWFVPAILTDASLSSGSGIRPPEEVIYTANKVSVSDTVSLTDGASVVVYSKVWNPESDSYENYAIDGSGDLVKVWESGSVVQWIDDEDTSLYWNFIQYGDTGYYEFYNPVTGKYLAPQSGQLISNSTIGVTLIGRADGDYTSTIEAWDGNVWSWYGYKYTDDARLIPAPDTQAAQMCFAVQREIEAFTPVETVDSKAEGITIKMYDYVNANEQNSVIGESTFTGDGNGARQGLVEKYSAVTDTLLHRSPANRWNSSLQATAHILKERLITFL